MFDRVDEPLGSIHFAFDEGDRLLLRPIGVRSGGIAFHHLPIFVGNPELRCIPPVDLEPELIALHRHVEVGDHRLDGARIVASGVAGFRVQTGDFRHGFPQRVLRRLQPRDQFVVMLLGECLELLLQDAVGQIQGGIFAILECLPLTVHLQQQALPQVPRTDSGRFQLLHNLQDIGKLFLVDLQALSECQVG